MLYVVASYDTDQTQIFLDVVPADGSDEAIEKLEAARPYATIEEVMAMDTFKNWADTILATTPEDAQAWLDEETKEQKEFAS